MKRRYKLLLIIFISFILIIIIYYNFKKDNNLYLSIQNNIMDYSYVNYLKINYKTKIINVTSITDLKEIILKNKYDINYYLKNSKIITIDLGTFELNNYQLLNEEILIDYLKDYYIVLMKINKITKNKVFLINYYNKDYSLINEKLKDYSNKFNIYYINQNIIKNENIYYLKHYDYINYKGYKNIYIFIYNKMQK